MAGYTRQSSFADGDIITAADSNDEFNQLLSSFSNTTGHKHDGTAAEGPVIGLIGDPGVATPKNKVVVDDTNNRIGVFVDVSGTTTEQLRLQDGAILPVTTNDIDIGSSSLKFKDGYFAGDVVANNISSAAFNGDLIPDGNNTRDIGSSSAKWKDLYIDGVAYLDSIAMSTTTVTDILDEDNMASDSATALATQQSIKAYVDTQLTAEDLDFQGDSGGALSVDLDSQTFTIAGGTGIDTSGSGQTLTVAIDSTVTTLTGTQTLTNKTLTSPALNTAVSGTAVLDEDNMASDSNTQLATQQSIKAYVDAQVATVPTGDITEVTAGDGLTGGGTTGAVTLNVVGGTGITANANDITIDSTVATLTDTQTFTNKTLTSAVLNGTISGTSIKDEDNMASDSATHLATQQSIKAYVDAEVAAIPVGDITSVVAGTGMTGGGTSGDVTLNVIGGTGITANAGDIAVDATVITGQTAESTIDASNDLVLLYDNSATALRKVSVSAITASGSGISAVVDDTTPQLGGALDTNGNNITFADDDAAVFGADTDLTIVHDSGTNSNIFKADSYAFRSKANANLTMEMSPGATNSVKLYHQGSEKLAVRAGGILVTGAVAATSVTGDGSGLTNLPASGDGGIAMAIALG